MQEIMKSLASSVGRGNNADCLLALLPSEESSECNLGFLTRVGNVKDVIKAVKNAKEDKKVLRVAGSRHSTRASIYPGHGGMSRSLFIV